MSNKLLVIPGSEWIVRIRQPEGQGPWPIFLLLHGWTGDETSMWIFASRLPEKAILIAPRALYPTQPSGYSWVVNQEERWPTVADFQPALERLDEILTQRWFPAADFSRLHLVGFSQGAALSFAFLLTQPERITSVAGLSGFLPEGAQVIAQRQPVIGKRLFLAHGTQDRLVPVDRARQAVDTLETAGAQVVYCEDDVGHKLSASCFRGLEAFFSDQANC
jgi:phospholipase/carboxylesterase